MEYFTPPFIHTDMRLDITATGQATSFTSEDSLSFRNVSDDQLIIVESTHPPDVQWMKGAIGNLTDLAITVWEYHSISVGSK